MKLTLTLVIGMLAMYPWVPIKIGMGDHITSCQVPLMEIKQPLPEITCTISSVKQSYKVGEVPQLEVKIRNQSGKDVYLIGSLDGSDIKWRMPHCYFTLRKPITATDSALTGRCKTLNPLRREDIVLVKPGSSFDPYSMIDHSGFFGNAETLRAANFREPGVYTIQFHYNSNSEKISHFRGDRHYKNAGDSIQLQQLFSKAAKIQLSSNTLEIRYEK